MTYLIYKKTNTYFPEKLIFFKGKLWLTSFFWDIFWFHSSLWLTFILLFLEPKFFSDVIYAIGIFIFWIAHRFSSLYLAWGTKSFRPLCQKQPLRFKVFPCFIGFGVFIFVFLIPEYFFPFSTLERIFCLFMIDFIWGTHHFAAQHYGMLRLFQNFYNKQHSIFMKNEDRFFCWGVGGVMVIIAEILHGTSYLQDRNLIPLPSSISSFEHFLFLKIFGTTLVLVFTIFMIYKAFIYKTGLPKVLYILGLGTMVIGAFQLEPFQFLMLWTLQHWMVSLGLACHIGRNDLKKTNMKVLSNGRKLYDKFSKKIFLPFCLCVFSVLMTPFFEIEAVSLNESYSEKIFPDLMKWLWGSDCVLFFIALGISTGFLHYWMDRTVYRFSDKETSMVTKKLIFLK